MDDVSHPSADLADLRNALMSAYLSGDGAEVERVMALITAAENAATPTSRPSPRRSSRQAA